MQLMIKTAIARQYGDLNPLPESKDAGRVPVSKTASACRAVLQCSEVLSAECWCELRD